MSVEYSGDVVTSVSGAIGTLEFWSSKANALSADLLDRFCTALGALGSDANLSAIILRSRGEGAFCAGAALHEIDSATDRAALERLFSGYGKLILALRAVPKITIARVHGKIVGGGVGLVAACDYAVAAEGAALRLSELSLGIGPYVIGPAVERRIGSGAFSALSIETGWRDAKWGEAHGLYSETADSITALDRQIEVLCEKLSTYPRAGIAPWKRALWKDTGEWDTLLPARAAQVSELAAKRSS